MIPFRHNGDHEHWLPLVEMVCNRGAGKEFVPKSVHHLTSYLRMAFCESVCIDLVGASGEGPAYSGLRDMVFHDLVAPNSFVGTLTVRLSLCSDFHVELAIRKF